MLASDKSEKERLHDDKQEIMITKASKNDPFQTLTMKPPGFLETSKCIHGRTISAWY
jgi:hypothetical protein